MKKRFTEGRIITILWESEAGSKPSNALKDQRHRANSLTLGSTCGGIDAPDAWRLKELESENAKLKPMVIA